MERFTTAIRAALKDRNWFGALFLSLAMPDICGSLETPKVGSKKRYPRWFNAYLATEYKGFLTAKDCYYLRCACLHEGSDTQYKFSGGVPIHFIVPFPGARRLIHKNYSNGTLQMDINIFCNDVCRAVDAWSQKVSTDQAIQSRIAAMLQVHMAVPEEMGRIEPPKTDLGSGAR